MPDHFDTQITCEEFYANDPERWVDDDDEEDFIPDEPDELPVADDGELDDNVTGDMEDSYWFTEEGGLTAEAYDWLAEQDSENGFC